MVGVSTSDEFDFELRSMVGHLIRVSQQVHHSLWSSEIGDIHLTSPQFAILHVLAQEQPLDQRTLGLRASLDRSTVAEIVSRLTLRGLLECTEDPGDGRKKRVALSQYGEEVHRSARVRAFQINEKLLEGVSTADKVSLTRILETIADKHQRSNS